MKGGDFKNRKLPILYITGNKPSTATPASAIEGGRWVHIASSTQDNDNCFFIHNSRQCYYTTAADVELIRSAAAGHHESDFALDALVEGRAAKSEHVRVVLRWHSSGNEVRLGLPVGL